MDLGSRTILDIANLPISKSGRVFQNATDLLMESTTAFIARRLLCLGVYHLQPQISEVGHHQNKPSSRRRSSGVVADAASGKTSDLCLLRQRPDMSPNSSRSRNSLGSALRGDEMLNSASSA
ncbi:hypothetical protein NDU88_004329 [Pleurodeles waltl]|uniref:Uncharacterized protein n=1 Tax=Pleurodeles waltl TaxID=8319 RepID=A0AAV7UHW0_PLEWA|nr:hypothetical protein NDU88_004329 [Pleurodeles waltl]